jgi:hypothetical protein
MNSASFCTAFSLVIRHFSGGFQQPLHNVSSTRFSATFSQDLAGSTGKKMGVKQAVQQN